MRVDAYFSQSHYAAHGLPVFDALPAEMKGTVWAPRQGCSWGRSLTTRPRREPWGPVIVASFADARKMAGRRLVLVEHGAGQSYQGVTSGSYSGGEGLADVALFLCPSEAVAGRWRTAYPQAKTAIVGCPRMDRWHRDTMESHGMAWFAGLRQGLDRSGQAGRGVPRCGKARADTSPVVAVGHHWRCGIIPEAQPAVDHFKAAYPALRDAVRSWGGELLGHGHPRGWREYSRLWVSLGIEAVEDSDEVLRRADLLVADNTSLMYEAASLGIPIVVLNIEQYRRDIEHGLRYWSAVPGIQVDEPDQLIPAVLTALEDPPELQATRKRAVEAAFAYTDGRAAERAAAAIVEVLGG